MRVPLSLPDLGVGDESVCVSGWLVDRGDIVLEGDRVTEVLISGVTFDIDATQSGQLVEIAKPVDAIVSCRDILAWIDTAADDSADAR